MKKVEERDLQHLAIIMDGNGRWAKKQGKPRVFGHKAGVKTLKKILIEAKKIGIKYLTVYAFSTENWKRPKAEVDALMFLFKEYLKNEIKELDRNNVALRFSGRKEGLSSTLLKLMHESEKKLSVNDGITLNIAFNYGGRAEIIDGINRALREKKDELLDEESFRKYLYQSDIPDPELIIRTSGEFRVSNFLLWQLAYAEFHITEKLWPDFDEEDLREAVNEYKKRERRYGGVKNA
jgi:undecaprenyl diphosphate synthase